MFPLGDHLMASGRNLNEASKLNYALWPWLHEVFAAFSNIILLTPQYLAYDGNWMHIFSPSQGTQMGSPNLESKGTHVLNGYSVPELTNPYIQCPIPSVNVDTESRISNIDMGWISDYVIR
jgi:hypothetical protein